MKDCTCKITPGTSAYGGNQIDSRGCEKHDTRDEIINTLRARLATAEGHLNEAGVATEFEGRNIDLDDRVKILMEQRDEARLMVDAAREHIANITAERDAEKNRAEVWEHATLAKDKQLSTFLEFQERLIADLDAARAGEARAVEALRTLNHAAKVAISTQYGNSFDEETPLTIRLLDGTCDETDAILASPALTWLAEQRAEAAAEVWMEVAQSHAHDGKVIGDLTEMAKCDSEECFSCDCIERAAALRAGAKGGSDDN